VIGVLIGLFGKTIGFALGMIFSIYLLVMSVLYLRANVQIVNQWLFPSLPETIVALVLFVPSLYALFLPFKATIGLCQISFIGLIVIAASIFFIRDSIDWRLAMPLVSSPLSRFLKAMPDSISSFGGLELLLMNYQRYEPGVKKRRWLVSGLVFAVLFQAIGVLNCTAIISAEEASTRIYPLLSIIKAAKPFGIDRLDVLFLTIWLPINIVANTAYLYESIVSLRSLMPKLPRALLIIVCSTLCVYITTLIKTVGATDYLMHISGYTIIATGILLPFLLFIISFVKGRGKSVNV
jgi:hypothetical protein